SIARALVTEPNLLLMDEPFAALDEITRFRLNNDLLVLWQSLGKTVIFVTHSVFESVYLSQRIIVMTRRPGRVFAELAIDAPYPREESFRTSAEYVGYCRRVSEALACASAATDGPRKGAPTPMRETRPKDPASPVTDRLLRLLLPIAVLALGVVLWELVVRMGDIPPYVLPSPWLVFSTLISDRTVLLTSLLVTLTTTLEGFLLAAIGGIGLAVLF